MIWRIRSVAVTASTNDDARVAAEAGEAEGLVVWALSQTAGRGRHGRTWASPQGNLYCSALLRPAIDPSSIGLYSFVAALALRDTVITFLPPERVALKWPNDVLVDGKKISGILLEAGQGGLVVGMGLNVQHHPETPLYPATSLAAAGAVPIELPALLDELLKHLLHWHTVMQTVGFAPVRAAWLEHATQGVMTVRLPQEVIEGTFDGLDANGNLRLKLANGSERSISTGDVFPALGS